MAKEEQIITPEGYVLPAGAKEITPPDSVGPVYLVPLTPEEIAEREQWAIEEAERQAAEEAKVAAKEAAKAKLAKLGLTDEEVAALLS
jgi:hypothetical protein